MGKKCFMDSANLFAHKLVHDCAARLPTVFGEFSATALADEAGKEHFALVKGKKTGGGEPALVRVHSECLTGDVFSSKKCDCQAQLRKSLELIGESEFGVLVYLRQEGRGIGLANKLRAYSLQDAGLDTVEANEKLGFGADERDYAIAAKILLGLGADRVRLVTNNPGKILGLERNGVKVVERIPLIVKKSFENGKYLLAKKKKLGHLL
ncbi:GTP cyclohydrolase II [Candidatus Micrarchaeota archaeon]|nr:GTP cyclohydrolase II [Candidatus Micrarchaeota archaeon]